VGYYAEMQTKCLKLDWEETQGRALNIEGRSREEQGFVKKLLG
jgi:hypothetical protein